MARSRADTTWTVFAVRQFRLLWTASLASIMGDQLARVALSVLVFQRTGSPALTAATYALTMLPALVSGVLLSWLADQFPRRRVMVACDVVRALLVGVMALPSIPLPLVAGLLVLAQLAEAPFSASQGAILPDVLGSRYEAGQAVQLITYQVCLVLGFAVGGVAVAAVGVQGALAIDAATFAVSAVLLRWGLDPHAHALVPAVSPRGWWTDIRSGAAVVMKDDRLRTLLWLGWLALFTTVPEGLAVPFARQAGAGGGWIGVLLAAEPIGAVAGALALRLVPRLWRLRALGLLAVATSLPLVGYWARPGLVAALVLLVVSGLFSSYQVTAGATFVQLTPPGLRGRALGFARTGQIAGQGVGVAAGGLLAQTVGAAPAIAWAGTAGALAALTAAAAWSRRGPAAVAAALPAES